MGYIWTFFHSFSFYITASFKSLWDIFELLFDRPTVISLLAFQIPVGYIWTENVHPLNSIDECFKSLWDIFEPKTAIYEYGERKFQIPVGYIWTLKGVNNGSYSYVSNPCGIYLNIFKFFYLSFLYLSFKSLWDIFEHNFQHLKNDNEESFKSLWDIFEHHFENSLKTHQN